MGACSGHFFNHKGECRPPNVLLMLVDDLNDWVGALEGHPQAQTPHIDRLMRGSVVFSNAHSAAVTCSPSRHAMLSGRHPFTTGWYGKVSGNLDKYTLALNGTTPLPLHFRRHGYKTMAAGKIYHRGVNDVKQLAMWDEVRAPYTPWPTRLVERGHGYLGTKGGFHYPFPRDGGGIYQLMGEGVRGISLCAGPLDRSDMPDPERMPDQQIAEWGVQRLAASHAEPFLLALGFVRPHVPYTAPKRFFDMYPGPEDITVPTTLPREMDGVPLAGKASAFGIIDGGDDPAVRRVGALYRAQLVRGYLACVSFVDAQIGKVMDALRASAYRDNTVVVFTSDHGQHLGEKNAWRKSTLWERSTRVPLAIQTPRAKKRAKMVTPAPASLVDLFPTLIELCSLPPVAGLDGRSLVPLWTEDATPGPAPQPQPWPQRQPHVLTTNGYGNVAVRTEHLRYIRYHDGSEELYDHRSDPDERDNLAFPSSAMTPERAELLQLLAGYLPQRVVEPVEADAMSGQAQTLRQLVSEGVPDWLGKVPQ